MFDIGSLDLTNLSLSMIIVFGIYLINIVLILVVIFTESKTPTSTLAWIMVLAFLPIVGFVFYILLNQKISNYKINRLNDNEDYYLSTLLSHQIDDLDQGKLNFNNPVGEEWKELVRHNQSYSDSIYTEDNKLELITDGNELFDSLIDDISKAERFVNLEYFIVKYDDAGKRLINALTESAKKGVEVRLLVDAQGSRTLGNYAVKELVEAGGKVAYFFKPLLSPFGFHFGLKLNFRNHRKIAIIDNRVAYTGGYNIGREYIDLKKKFGHWRDSHIKITGTSILGLNLRFAQDWRFSFKEDIDIISNFTFENNDGNVGVQIVSCGPESPKQEIKRGMMKMISNAQKNIFIQTPYFVPDPALIESLKIAAQSGIDVRIMIPCKPDHIFVYWATYSFIGELLRDGAKAYIYDNGFLHAKTLTVDGEVSTIGSANFDIRSFYLNFETNAFVFDSEFTEDMENAFLDDIRFSHELTYDDYLKRSLVIKFKEAISRLFASIL